MPKVFRVNMKAKSIKCEELKEEYADFGGRGLIANVMNDEVNPKCDPLGSENKLIISLGLLSGTTGPTVNRLSVGGKSPLTGGIKEANVGGNVGFMLAKHDIKMIIFEGIPADEEWFILKVDKDSNVHLVPANQFAGLNNYALVEKCREEFGDKISVLSIGVAGERGYRSASIQATDTATGHPARAAARGGLGALMGSKKVKAIVVDKAVNPNKIKYKSKRKFSDATMKVISAIRTDALTGYALPNFGTPFLTKLINDEKMLPVNNFRGETVQNIKPLDEETFKSTVLANEGKVGVACQPGCPIRCSNIYNNENKEYVTSGLEYETIALCGPNCGIYSFDTLAKIDSLCDDFGIDTIEAGATIAICMEAGKLEWGDEKGALSLLQEMIDGTEFGEILGHGTEYVGKKLGVKRIPTVKSQALPGYDPRGLKGIGVTYATSTMGADHTAGHTFGAEGIDPFKKEGQVKLSEEMQIGMALCDNIMCLFAFGAISSNPESFNSLAEMMSARYGGEWSIEKLLGIGAQTIVLEKAFNEAAGLTSEDDKLPEFFYTEESPAAKTAFDITNEELAEIFQGLKRGAAN